MTELELSPPEMVDLVFPLAGHSLARDHAQPLADALGAADRKSVV